MVRGQIFADIWGDSPKQISPQIEEFKKQIKGKKVLDIKRRAKVLIFELGSSRVGDSLAVAASKTRGYANIFLLIHLKLTGQLIFRPKKGKLVYGGHPLAIEGGESLPNQFTHVYFTFKDGSKLFFNDLRKFGWVRLVGKEQASKLASELGVQPLSKEFNLQKFAEIIKKYPNRKIKQILMDQKLIAGIGNIYADESCFCARILPTRPAKTSSASEMFRSLPSIWVPK